ncbi:thioesterase family protein-like protein [Cucurbitaria berberidis CBS 394.84]|uniref:Thioesterase family protein-like protein n=1 Tax=Cucurbitaria berberidis CBS 394.84 TaxID=1168544 RepID=A0A9P4GT84_9PLEO|nr:thioesterase family protein-like protein [Cucurbitaria berberidis CBS 394.84]KAF1851099.1 thioesterase family protein-like protein [Cucurbitaria berberidis CBS 394.84]
MGDPEADRKKAIAAVQAMFDRYTLLAARRPKDHIDFDREVMENFKIIDAGLDGSVTYELYMAPNFSNLNNVMHGGAAGVIFDMSTTTALCPIARPGFWEFMAGVTRSLNISYLKAVPIGIKVRLNSKVVSVGKQMAMIRGDMTSLDGKTTYCTVEHHKVNVPTLPEHLSARISWDDEFDKEWKDKTEKQVKSKM